jgi:UDP-N-acetylglucosamine 4,6-dehydratase/5-epimerase
MKKIKKLNPLVTKELKNKTILITGGAGSIGSHLTKRILEYPIKAVRVLDIDEHALFRLGREVTDKRLRPLLGNILDMERMELAGQNVDIVLHTAAIKNIEISEYNPIETINTNVNGTVNLVKMAMKNSPKKFLNISTDKAADSTTLYGTTKNLGEKLITWAGQYLPPTKFASTRFGNVIETRGNVFEIWNEEKNNKKPLSITHPSMERYFFTIDEAVEFCLDCLLHIKSGEIFIPKMKSYKIKDLANKVSKDHNTIGLRNGEKMSEILMTDEEKKRSIEKKKMWVIKSS